MIQLKNSKLQIDISEPNELYKSTRFDWTGLISQVTLDRKHTFCTNETTDASIRSEKGIGMCNEFGISTPVGYDDCPVGQKFLKIGTGRLLKESNDPYDFFKKYKITPAIIEIEAIKDFEAIISSSDNDERGYAYYFQKKYSLKDNKLIISCNLKNRGIKKITTEEYCHNFMALNNMPVNNAYSLEFDSKFNENFEHTVNPNDCTAISTHSMSWKSIPESDFFFSKLGNMKSWKIKNTASGTYVSEKVSFQPAYCNLWGKGHVISPELFFSVNLNAGEEVSWQREYEFGRL